MRVLFFSILLGLSNSVYSVVNGNGDIQLWNKLTFQQEIDKKLNFFYEGELRFGDDVSRTYFGYGQFRIAYTPIAWFEIGPGYRHDFVRRATGWTQIYVPFFQVKFIYSAKNWGIEDRNRLQYLFFQDDISPKALYRNLLHMYYRIHLAHPLKIFLEDEVFFLQTRGFSQNRLTGGISVSMNSVVRSKLFYMVRHLKGQTKWTYQNVFGIYFTIGF